MSDKRSLRSAVVASVVAFAVSASGACALGMVGDQAWAPASSAELSGADDLARATSPVRFLSASGDFDGDGKADKAQLVVNRGLGTYGVRFTFGGDRREHIEPIAPLVAIKSAGLRSAPAGHYQGCLQGGPRCEKQPVDTKNDGVILFAFESSERLMYWNARTLKTVYLSD